MLAFPEIFPCFPAAVLPEAASSRQRGSSYVAAQAPCLLERRLSSSNSSPTATSKMGDSSAMYFFGYMGAAFGLIFASALPPIPPYPAPLLSRIIRPAREAIKLDGHYSSEVLFFSKFCNKTSARLQKRTLLHALCQSCGLAVGDEWTSI